MPNKMQIRYLLLFFIAMLLLYASCEEKIDLTLDETYERLVVEGDITNQPKAHTVKLTRTTSYFYKEEPPAVEGATVTISDGFQDIVLTEMAPGIYQTDPNFAGIPGRKYHLKIKLAKEINNKDYYEAFSFMKPTIYIDSIACDPLYPEIPTGRYLLNAWAMEPPTLDDYYFWNYYKNGVLETDTISESVFTDDALVNGNYIPGMSLFLLKANPGDTITLESRSISKEYYEFIVSLMLETVWISGNFGGPPANVKTNISNGGLGFFNASAVSFLSCEVPR